MPKVKNNFKSVSSDVKKLSIAMVGERLAGSKYFNHVMGSGEYTDILFTFNPTSFAEKAYSSEPVPEQNRDDKDLNDALGDSVTHKVDEDINKGDWESLKELSELVQIKAEKQRNDPVRLAILLVYMDLNPELPTWNELHQRVERILSGWPCKQNTVNRDNLRAMTKRDLGLSVEGSPE